MTDNNQYVRSFNSFELDQIRELKQHMSTATDVQSWNEIRSAMKRIFPEKIISAVDGLRKWHIKYDKPTKTITYLGVILK
jgi:hypothetical protein